MNNIGYLTASNNDELYTPYYASEPLMKYIPVNKIVWCPFDKEWSSFVQLLIKNGNKVIYSHIDNYLDFFKYEPDEYDIIISNPPFSIKDKILERIYSFNKPFAILLPLNSLQGKTRYKYFKNGIQLLSFHARISYHDKRHLDNVVKGSPFATAYFCKDLLPKDLVIEKLETYERPLL